MATHQERFRRFRSALETLSYVMMIVAAGAVVWTTLRTPEGPVMPPRHGPTEIEGTMDPSSGRVLGDGQLVIVEFVDYECPFCQRFSTETFPALREHWIETGKVRFISMHLPLETIHPSAKRRAAAAHCVGDRLWDLRSQIYGKGDPDLDALGVSPECIESPETAAAIQAGLDQAAKFGAVSTPTFLLGTARADGSVDLAKRIPGAVSLETLTSELSLLERNLE